MSVDTRLTKHSNRAAEFVEVGDFVSLRDTIQRVEVVSERPDEVTLVTREWREQDSEGAPLELHFLAPGERVDVFRAVRETSRLGAYVRVISRHIDEDSPVVVIYPGRDEEAATYVSVNDLLSMLSELGLHSETPEITFTNEELQVIRVILAHVGGDPDETPRGLADKIARKIDQIDRPLPGWYGSEFNQRLTGNLYWERPDEDDLEDPGNDRVSLFRDGYYFGDT